MSSSPRLCWRARSRAVFVLAVLLLAAPVLAQQGAKESFLAVQRQVETLQPGLVKSTVALRVGGASGSGVIISPDGYVLTAAHVIAGPPNRRCFVVLADGRSVAANVLGSDRQDDFGLVKIRDAQDLPTSPLGDSDALRQGEWVVATGHPLGLRPGRPPVLRIGRVLRIFAGRGGRQPEIMTDAPLINGDSGGPLFDLTGRVVGINSMISGGTRRMVSMHVPVNPAEAVLEKLKKGEDATPDDVRSAPGAEAMRHAEEALAGGDASVAVRAAAENAKANPYSATARVLLARAYARTGKVMEAAAAVQDACDRGYDDVDALRDEPDLARLKNNSTMKLALSRVAALHGIPGARKGDQTVLAQAANLVPGLERGVVRVVSGGSDVALGTVMSADGYILTKASELPDGPLSCVLPEGRTVAAERKGVDAGWDVALLKVNASGMETVRLADSASVGAWTFSPNASGTVAAVGMVGVTEMPVRDKGMAGGPTSKAYMGVMLQPLDADALKQLGLKSGVGVEVQPGLPAAQAGVRTGDVILEIDGKAVRDPDAVMDLFVNKKPGDTAVLKLARGEERLTVTVSLAARPAGLPGRGGLPAMVSGPVSRMQGPFPRVLEHDAVLTPELMGGPVLDSTGRCLGLNIARADRVCTYAIQARDVKDIFARFSK